MCSDLRGSETILIHYERLQISEAGQKQKSQFDVVFKSVALVYAKNLGGRAALHTATVPAVLAAVKN